MPEEISPWLCATFRRPLGQPQVDFGVELEVEYVRSKHNSISVRNKLERDVTCEGAHSLQKETASPVLERSRSTVHEGNHLRVVALLAWIFQAHLDTLR